MFSRKMKCLLSVWPSGWKIREKELESAESVGPKQGERELRTTMRCLSHRAGEVGGKSGAETEWVIRDLLTPLTVREVLITKEAKKLTKEESEAPKRWPARS